MIEFIQAMFAFVLTLVFAWLVWESGKMIDEKKQRQREGKTNYYDEEI